MLSKHDLGNADTSTVMTCPSLLVLCTILWLAEKHQNSLGNLSLVGFGFFVFFLCVFFLTKNTDCQCTQIKFSALCTADIDVCRLAYEPAKGRIIITDK